MNQLAAFIRLSRPKFLVGGFVAYALGVAVAAHAGARIQPAQYVLGQATVTAFHLMTHYANDYFDRHADVHTTPSAFAGGSGVLVRGDLAPHIALRAALACMLLGSIAGVCLARSGHWAAALIGTAIVALAWSYSAPPLRLQARGWGEFVTAGVVGVLVPLAGFTTFVPTLDAVAWVTTVAPACAMFAMMIAVEWPDHAADAAAGKRNMLVRVGTKNGTRLGAAGALLIVPALGAATACGAPATILVFGIGLTPLLAGFVRRLASPSSAAGDIAAHGVTLFLVTVAFEFLGYIAVLH